MYFHIPKILFKIYFVKLSLKLNVFPVSEVDLIELHGVQHTYILAGIDVYSCHMGPNNKCPSYVVPNL